MSKQETLFSITESGRDGINFQVPGGEKNKYIVKHKEEVIAALDRLRIALINETYPFSPLTESQAKDVPDIRETLVRINAKEEEYLNVEFSFLQERLPYNGIIKVINERIYVEFENAQQVDIGMTTNEFSKLRRNVSLKRISLMINEVAKKNKSSL